MTQGFKDDIEQWVKHKGSTTSGLTSISQNNRESRKQHTWFSSGEEGRRESTAGFGTDKYLKYMKDMEPVTDRPMYLPLRGYRGRSIIHANRRQTNEEKADAYDKLQKPLIERKTKDVCTS